MSNNIEIEAISFPFPEHGEILKIEDLTYDKDGNVLNDQYIRYIQVSYKGKLFKLNTDREFYDDDGYLIQKNYPAAEILLMNLVEAMKKIDKAE